MDNLPVHGTAKAKEAYADCDIMRISNVAYSPDFNPIEACFSQVKRHFCKERLNALTNYREFVWNRTIRAAFTKVTPALVTACWRRSLNLL